jgi:hypothetical protein
VRANRATPRLRLGGILLGAMAAVSSALPLAGQVTSEDVVFTGGVSGEGYQGNLPTASVGVRDSTEVASAAVGEVGARGVLLWRRNGVLAGSLNYDGGVRQFSAQGFQLRDYAPREWSGTAEANLYRSLGERGRISFSGRVRARDVEDRPPMPLFLHPGYLSLATGIATQIALPEGREFDLRIRGEKVEFYAPALIPQVRMLDRLGGGIQGGVTTPLAAGQSIRLYGGFDYSAYREQPTFEPEDPFRRDRTYSTGVSWSYRGGVLGQLGLEGRFNRSNSLRPDYNSVTMQALVSVPMPGAAVLSAVGALTYKGYLEPTPFARLIPGEEANNASLAYVSLGRALAQNLDGTLRLGWTRAETEIGGNYFQRVGVSALLHYRPGR